MYIGVFDRGITLQRPGLLAKIAGEHPPENPQRDDFPLYIYIDERRRGRSSPLGPFIKVESREVREVNRIQSPSGYRLFQFLKLAISVAERA